VHWARFLTSSPAADGAVITILGAGGSNRPVHGRAGSPPALTGFEMLFFRRLSPQETGAGDHAIALVRYTCRCAFCCHPEEELFNFLRRRKALLVLDAASMSIEKQQKSPIAFFNCARHPRACKPAETNVRSRGDIFRLPFAGLEPARQPRRGAAEVLLLYPSATVVL